MLTREQKDRLIRVVDSDAKTTGTLHNHAGETCYIGGLLVAAGVPGRLLKGRGSLNEEEYAALKSHYGIDRCMVADWMAINDRHTCREIRQSHLRAAIEAK